MAIFTCSQTDLVNDSKDYRVPVITPHMRKALMAYAKVRYLATIVGGTDYNANYPLLFSDAAVGTRGTDKEAIEAARLWMEFTKCENQLQNANNPVTLPATISAKIDAAKVLALQPDDILDRVLLFLDCKINAATFNI